MHDTRQPQALLAFSQNIPNPNQERLGLPDLRSPDPQIDRKRREQMVLEAHRRAVAYARQMHALAKQLRNDLEDLDSPLQPAYVRRLTGQIEKLARKVRSELKL